MDQLKGMTEPSFHLNLFMVEMRQTWVNTSWGGSQGPETAHWIPAISHVS